LPLTDLRVLGLLPQLESLRLWLFENDSHWSDGLLRTLGGLPLHHLHSLRLEGDDACTQLKEGANPPLPC